MERKKRERKKITYVNTSDDLTAGEDHNKFIQILFFPLKRKNIDLTPLSNVDEDKLPSTVKNRSNNNELSSQQEKKSSNKTN